MSKIIDHLTPTSKKKMLTIKISGDASTIEHTNIKVEKVLGGKSTAWRAQHIAAIRDRCRELDLMDEKLKYMQENFGIDSLTLLSDADIEEIYQWITQYR